MTGWLESLVGPDYANALMWIIVALIALLVLLILVRIVRGFGVGTFVAGGRNRKARLAVMDATAVDSHRRLILVRRDDVEHLILIGGPTDVVVEQNIRLIAPTRRAAIEDELPRAQPQPVQPIAPAPRPAPPPRQAPAPMPAPVAPVVAPPATVRAEPQAQQQAAPLHGPSSTPPPVTPDSYQRVRRVEMPIAPQTTPPPPQPHAVVSPSPRNEIDAGLLQELELSLDSQPVTAPAATTAPLTSRSEPDKTLDDEMSKLLNDLAGQR